MPALYKRSLNYRGERSIGTMVSLYTNNAYCCHELFGFDILLDENFKVWLLEVNISPRLVWVFE